MEAHRFDSLSRSLRHGLTRRTLTSVLSGLAVTRLLGAPLDLAQAKNGGGKKGGGKKGGGGKRNKKDTLECSGRGHILCPAYDYVTKQPLYDPTTGDVLSGCVNVYTHPDHCGFCGNGCARDPELGARDFVCREGSCVCTGVICADGRCCPEGYTSCIGEGEGCCPTGYYGCPNGQPVDCCPTGYTCGGTCGQQCCQP